MEKPLNYIDYLINKIRTAAFGDDRYIRLEKYLGGIKKDPASNPFVSSELLAELTDRILTAFPQGEYIDMIEDAAEIYRLMFPFDEHTENYELIKLLFLKLFDKDGIYFNELFSPELYITFDDKIRWLDVMYSIINIHGAQKKLDIISETAVKIRPFFPDEKAYAAAVISASADISVSEDEKAASDRIIEEARKTAGIYDISEAAVREAAENVRRTNFMLEDTIKNLSVISEKISGFDDLYEKRILEFRKNSVNEIKNLKAETENTGYKIKKAYEDLLASERKSLDCDRDALIRDVLEAADSKIRELRVISETIRANTSAELYRINAEANKAVDRAAEILQSDELKDIISELNKDGGLVEKIIRVENFSRRFDENDTARITAATAVPSGTVCVPAPYHDPAYDKPADMTVNYFFDEKIPFTERMSRLKEKKQDKIISGGSIYHEKFDDILTAVIEDSNPYMIGPSGCGKTFITAQISELLGIECYDIGYINEEYDILGFRTASGDYSYPVFYRAYKYGGIVFCDEFDNSNSRAAVKLNSFMTEGKNAGYCFPNGERVPRHPNFRIIAAGNTAGNGADRNYSTREKIEESVQQRFTAIYVGYDNRLEKSILADYPEWYGFAEAFRAATDEWSRANDCAAPGIFTTRDAARIKKYLDHKSFSAEAIIDYEFIETKDNEYLTFIIEKMQEHRERQKVESFDLFEIFKNRAEMRRNGGVPV